MRHAQQSMQLALLSSRDKAEDGWITALPAKAAPRQEPRTVVLPGEWITGMLRVTGDPDKKATGVTARLVSRVTWKEHRNSGSVLVPDPPFPHEEKSVVAEAPVGRPGEPIAAGGYSFRLQVPDDALPSARSHDLWDNAVDWWVAVHVDRRHGFDAEVDGAFVVAAPAERATGVVLEEPTFEGNRFFGVVMATRTVRAGDSVTGKVVIGAPQDMQLERMDARLELNRKDGPDLAERGPSWQTREHFAAARLTSQMSLRAGETTELAFDLRVPPTAPTLHSRHCSFDWTVHVTGVTAEGKTTDARVPLLVHNDLPDVLA